MSQPIPAASSMQDAYRELRGSLLAFLRRQTGDATVAEDLLHDVVVKALVQSRDSATTPRNLAGWLFTVARNAAMDHHRKKRPVGELPESLADAPIDEDAAALEELSNCLRPLAERLPDTYRHTVIAAEFKGQSLAEVAAAEGISLAAAKARASRGRRLLHRSLLQCCRAELAAAGLSSDDDLGDVDLKSSTGCASKRC